ncbi:MAG: flavodoxin-dependent (E)-4-hydroxy-3-methylbut-2-enyl-diphosphate synthase [Dehalococcoidales bacterium]|nr:flavodoxin-dependent (E)-4-hydroxy-3-methylbut-2-enyl-diphosphate synthase [Dehalococcoidales bacterium]MDD3265193.1 flavodoxin-dependent (E)-4-hydroxy-3-methylbut-2-enyl-diphosphate synthase [Dehalococcoidales bacterium]MDD4322997.1 flavodoxin-dependent (E)-4-hydroxy-3-methylbut-2-enyl-diphosphate synthase [Dehalococcoidales bacterium]MDD4794690.1 flavodoxin-dependent (E)-4-hydroxy-3-methylbut-2-enyl-diphosphate synthase [Dehalococcoidales bacterium]MDD5498999.1 flavodoxin-dependent (E)-4-h
MINRRRSRIINIGGLTIGGDSPVAVQSMTKTDTRDIKSTVRQIKELEAAGCEMVRVAVPDQQAAAAIKSIKSKISIPLMADIHFDYRLALLSIENGTDGLRLNPGNIGGPDRVRAVVKEARARQIPIRIGVNAGSLPVDLDPALSVCERMVLAAMREVKLLEELDFDLIKISLKAFDVPTTIESYRTIADMVDYPLHIGITEAGIPPAGIIRSTAGIAPLLYLGIGDTIRVSLTASPVEEIVTAYEILKSLNLRSHGPILISCPTCGRTEIDVAKIATEVNRRLSECKKSIKVAVMGCAVNGPGEASEADIGIAGGRGKALIFKHGHKLRPVNEADIVEELMKEIDSLEA